MATGQEILHLKLMSYKNKGKTYVRAYRNKWIAPIPEEAALGKKGRSVPAVQIQVGVIQPSGMVKMSSKFGSVRISVSGEVIPGAAQRGCLLFFVMQYARPDAIAGAKVEGPARSAGGSSLAPAIARREAAGALAREV